MLAQSQIANMCNQGFKLSSAPFTAELVVLSSKQTLNT